MQNLAIFGWDLQDGVFFRSVLKLPPDIFLSALVRLWWSPGKLDHMYSFASEWRTRFQSTPRVYCLLRSHVPAVTVRAALSQAVPGVEFQGLWHFQARSLRSFRFFELPT